MTARAILERHRAQHGHRLPRRIDRRAEARGQVTFRACDVPMLARERVRASRVVEPGCVLPGPGVMTPRAGALEAAAVWVGVTARAVCFNAHPSGRGPARRERCGTRHAEPLRVARRALQSCMALFQRVSGSARMVESLRRPARPLNELKLEPRMIGVTAGTRPAAIPPCVQPSALLPEPGHLAMTRETLLRGGFAPPAVALRAVGRPLERSMWAREWARRNLRAGGRRAEHHDDRGAQHGPADAQPARQITHRRKQGVNWRWPPPHPRPGPW